MKYFKYALLGVFSLGFIGAIGALLLVGGVLHYYGQDLPDYEQLKEYEPPIITRVYAGDGRLMAEFASEKRVFMPIDEIPDLVKNAFISAEDQNFYTHPGVDFRAVARAVVLNLKNVGRGRRLVGASTITQQVAKNFLLTNEVSYERKIKEAILAYRMEKALSKDRLLELYLNEIYLGVRAYGVAAAAQIYFDKSLDDLTVDEAAYLAALPKAPNNYHPTRKKEAAVTRRNWVIGRMADEGYISQGQAELAMMQTLEVEEREGEKQINSPYFSEEIRRQIKAQYGDDALYHGGLAVRSTIDPELQANAQDALQNGLMSYDKRHGWRGPLTTLSSFNDWKKQLSDINPPDAMLSKWSLAIVLNVDNAKADIALENGDKGKISLKNLKWARKSLQEGYALGAEITRAGQVLSDGDVIMVEPDGSEENTFFLRQIPEIQGALIALDPHTGRVLAMQGGWTYTVSEYNRATQAERQPGSAFKPFVYLAALEQGFTPASLILDAPITIEDRPGNFWSPTNYSDSFFGPTTIRVGVEKSKNLMTVRLANHLGMDYIAEYAEKLGIHDKMPRFLSYSLGAGETTLLKMTAAYGMLVNGGKKVTPSFIDRVQDRYGKTIFAHDNRPCDNCGPKMKWLTQPVPDVTDTREQLVDERVAYQMVSILQGVVERGTGVRLKSLNRPLAGKTGTTNKSKDAWFVGFSPDLVVGVYTGFDNPRSLGKRETGSSVAAPIFKEFMSVALKDEAPAPFRIPPGLQNIQINPKTGQRASIDDDVVIWESFLLGTSPETSENIMGDMSISGNEADLYIDPYVIDPDAAYNPNQKNARNNYRNIDIDEQPLTAPISGTGGLY